MILHINDKTNSAKTLYYQSLVLLYLPCEKFSENEDDKNHLFVDAYIRDETYHAKVVIELGDITSSFEDRELIDESVYAQMKNLIGRTFLKAAEKIFGFLPPWGISTGVKPVKLARMFVNTLGKYKAYEVLTNNYMITPQKAKMAVEGCLFENSIIDLQESNAFSLYVSIPFCPTKCNYCSFVSCTTPRLLSLIPDYIVKLNKELVTISKTANTLGLNLKSIYVGGGTPAILNESQTDSLLNTIYTNFKTDNCEFTFEAGRPDCITHDKLKVLSDYGVGRISINTQTTNDEILRAVGRNHSYKDYVSCMESARKLSFKCINTDLIAGLPGESAESFMNSVNEVSALSPENITIHAFTLKRSSNYRIGGDTSFKTEVETANKMTDYASAHLNSLSYTPYYVYRQKNTVGNLENVGYAKKGYESIYNIIMMGEYHTVFGAGAGSVTKIVTDNASHVERIFAPKYPYEFLDDNKYSGFDMNTVIDLLEKR